VQFDVNHTQEGIGHGHKPVGQDGRTQGREVEERQDRRGRGIRTSSSLSHESRAERGGVCGMGTSSALSASEASEA
jgi:hypothetical protein